MNKMVRVLAVFFVIIVWQSNAVAQVTPPPPPATDTSIKILEIINADRQGFKKTDSVTELQFLVGHVEMKQENTLFYCDSAVYNKKLRIIEAFGNVHINDHDSVHTYAQYLLYNVDTKIAVLKKKVKLTDGKTSLFSEEIHYDVNQKIGEYHNHGRVESGTSKLTSKEAIYYSDLKDAYFKKDVVLTDPKYKLKSDSLLYNTSTEIATFIAETYIEDSAKRKIRTREGYYDLKHKQALFTSRTFIDDGAVKIVADKIETIDSTGYSKLSGNAVYTDSAQGVSILANQIIANRNEGNFLATQHPLMILKQDQDSIYITADTLFSGRLSKLFTPKDSIPLKDTIQGNEKVNIKGTSNDSTDRFFQAYRHVRIFSDSLQAVADSLFYSGKDSIFQLYQQPILWSNNNQVTGDTIYLYTKDKQVDRMYVFENGMLISKARENMFNQIRGNRLTGYFKDGVIDYMRAKGNAESVYYIEDDDKLLIGVNKASGDIIDIRFLEKAVNRVVFINDVKGTMYPVTQLPEGEKLLRNFHWYEEKRPKTKFELFGN